MKLSKSTIFLLTVLIALIIVVWLLPRFGQESTGAAVSQARKPLQQRGVDLNKLQPRLRAIYLAEQIEDPVERCLNFPPVEGVRQTSELIEYLCEAVVRRWDFAESVQLLNNAKFEEVEQQIDMALSNYLESGIDESLPYSFLDTFYYQSKWSTRIANEWLNKRPNSPAALAAKAAIIGNQVGVVLKGRKMSDLTDEERVLYKELSAQENQLLEKAIELNSSFLPAINSRLANTRYEPDEIANLYLKMGLEVDPNSYFIRNSYLHRLLPQWHGSFEEMEAFTNESMAFLDQNPELIFLIKTRDLELGRKEWAKRNYEEALAIYNESLNAAPSARTWETSAAVYKDMGDRLSEFERLSQATRFGGYRANVESKRVRLLIEFSELQWAEELALSALERYPDYLDFYLNLGWLYKNDMQFEEAIAMHKLALELDPDSVYAHTEIAWIYTYRIRNNELAKPHIDALLEINPEDYQAWLYLSDFLHETGGEPLFNALENFLKYVDRDDPNMKQSIGTIESYMATHSGDTK